MTNDRSLEATKAASASTDTEAKQDQTLARFLVEIGLVDPRAVEAVDQAETAEPAGSLLDRLHGRGLLSDHQRQAIARFLAETGATGGNALERQPATGSQATDVGELETLSIKRSATDSLPKHPAPNPLPEIPETIAHPVTAVPGRPMTPGTFGDYEILNEIAKGGMGAVYRARQTKLNRIVALKLIRAAELADSDQVQRFYREAEAAAKLNHPGIVSVFDVGKAEGQHFLSMAFVDGESLAGRVKREGPLPARVAAKMIQAAAEAVQCAHQSEIIHRDLKPQNILLDKHDNVQVTDFGLAKVQLSDSELTTDGQVLGTPAYMPPEQAAGHIEQVGVAADVYSLGATLYYLLVGRPPFQAASITDTLRQVLDNEPVPPRQLDSSIPRDVETICLKALRKDVSQRYATAEDLAGDLDRWLTGQPILARRVGAIEKSWKWCRRNPLVTSAAIVLLLAFLITRGVITANNRHNELGRLDDAISMMINSSGETVVFAIKDLDDFSRRDALREVQRRYAAATLDEQSSLVYGLAHLGDVRFDTLIDALTKPNASPIEVMNIVAALGCRREESRARLKAAAVAATKKLDWQSKSRLAIAAMHLGDTAIAAEMFQGIPLGPAPFIPDTVLFDSYRQHLSTQAAAPDDRPLTLEQRLSRGQANLYLDRPQQALIDLEVLADSELGEKYDRIQLLYAIALLRTGQPGAAQPVLERIPAGDKSGSTLRESSEIIVAGLGGNLDRADRLLDAIVAKYTGNEIALHNAADAAAQLFKYCRDQQLPQADSYAERAVSLLRRAYVELDWAGRLRKVDQPHQNGLLLPLHERADFRELIRELYPDTHPWDNAQRTRLIANFGMWHADLGSLADAARLETSPHFCSGISLAVGGIGKPPESEKEQWVAILAGWHTEAADGGVHSATEWALRQWGVPLPSPPVESKPENRNWWRALDDLTLVKIPTASFQVDNDLIKIDNDFWISDREITWRQFRRFIEDADFRGLKPSWQGPHVFKELSGTVQLDHPAQKVSWYQAVMFCNWMSDRCGLKPCYDINANPQNPAVYTVRLVKEADGFCLPTDEQWEHACRAMTTSTYSFGDQIEDLVDYGIFADNSNSKTARAGSLRCNAWGLFDMHGNVYEWCWDQPGDDSENRVFRSGGWYFGADDCTSSIRLWQAPSEANLMSGFRVTAAGTNSSPAIEAR